MFAERRPDFRSPNQSVTQARGFRNRSNRSGYLLKGVSGHELPKPLSGREREVLRLVAAGLSNREIAE